MASAPARPPRRWPRRLLAGLAALAILLGAGFWLLGRESTLRTLAQQIANASGGQIAISDVSGSLYGAMQIGHLRYRSAQRIVTAERIAIAWSPLQFFSRGVAISRLDIAGMLIESVGPPQAATLPATLAPPFPLEIAEARLAHLTLRSPEGSAVLDALRFRLSGDAAGWRLREAGATTPWGQLAATADVKAQRPFALDASASLTPAAAPYGPARLAAKLHGNLSLLDLQLDASSPYASGQAWLTLAPFDPVILRALRMDGRDIDPSRFEPAWPAARLRLEVQAAIGPGEHVSGQLALSNQGQPGPLDGQRLPLRGASAQLGGTLAATRIDAVLLDLAAAGKLRGAGRIDNGGRAAFQLHADGIDLQALHSRMKKTRIGGDIELGSSAAGHTLDALLAEDGLRLALQATFKDMLLQLREARLQAGKGSLRITGQANLRDAQAFQASASAQHFNPADVGAYPAADLNADLRLAGHLAPNWQAQAQFTLGPSRLLQQPLSGTGRLTAAPGRVSALQARLALGRNTATLDGNFGRPGDSLGWRLEMPQLAALPGALTGALTASGLLRGTLEAPRSSFTAEARGLGLAGAPRAAADSMLQASGEAALAGPRRQLEIGALSATARRFSPDAFGPYPAGNLNADLKGSARLGADWRLALDLALQGSTLAQAPLAGSAKVTASPGRLQHAELDLRLGPNSVQARGAFGAPSEQLDWQLNAPQLASLGAQWGGALRGAGALSGSMAAPALSLALDGSNLRLAGHRARTLHISASLGTGLGRADPLHSDIELAGYSGPGLALAGARLQTRGTGAAHTLRLAAHNDDFDAQAQASGGWNGAAWNGTLDSLQNRGRFALSLRAPAPLRLSSKAGGGAALLHPEQLSVADAVLQLGGGSVSLRSLEKDGAHWRSSGQASGVPLAYLAQFSPVWRENTGGDLTLGARWALALQAGQSEPALAGSLHVYRERGDLTVGAELPLALGLRTLDAQAEVAANTLRLQLAFDGARAGQARLESSIALAHGRIGADSALNLSASANMGSLAWLAPLTGLPGLELDGALTATLSGGGSIGNPQLSGDIGGEKLLLNWAEQGVKLRNGRLQAKLSGDQLQLQRLSFDGVEGGARAEGWLRFSGAGTSLRLTLAADRLLALARPDRTLVVSGSSELVRDGQRLHFAGKFKAERAQIELAAQNTPALSDDVVVLGRGGAPARSATLPLSIDVEADLGDDFYLKGKGLDAQLAGSVHLRVPERGAPRANGSIRVVAGTYAAYGQKLQIERGVLNFTGAYDNPGLNLLAVRKRPEGETLSESNVEAGVEVRGTALAPTAKLVSTPAVPDSEKLAWLVLGHGNEGTAGRELGLLTTAAGALFGNTQGGSLQTRLAGSLGLDELALSQAKGLESTVVTLGKRLSQRAYLSVEQGASTATSLVRLRYKLNARITLQFQTGANSALDVLYTWTFD